MKLKYAKLLSLSIIALLATSPAFSMLILKQEKKKSPAYLFTQKRHEKDLYLPRQQEDRKIFEYVIVFGEVATKAVSSVSMGVGLALLEFVSQVTRGESLLDPRKNRKEREERELEKLCKFKSNYYNLDREDLDYMEDENFPKNYNGTYSYKIELDNNHERGYRFVPDCSRKENQDFYDSLVILKQTSSKGNFATESEQKKEIPSTSCSPNTKENKVVIVPKGCFVDENEKELSPGGCFNEPTQENIAQGCFTEDVKNNQPEGCFNEGELVKIPLIFRYEGQIKPGDVFFPDIPRREDGFKSHIKKGKIKKEVHKNGQRGFKDKKGNWWIPSGKNASAHGGEHWDLIDSDGNHLDNIYPGGTNRSGKISKYTSWSEALPIQEIKTVPEKTSYGSFSGGESVHHAASVANEVIHRWEPNDNWTDKQREIYNKIERARSLTRDDVKEFTPACSLEEYYKHFGATKYDSGVTLSPEAQELYDSPDFMDKLQQMSEDAGLLKDFQENPFEKFEHPTKEEEKSDHKEENPLKKDKNTKEDEKRKKPVKEEDKNKAREKNKFIEKEKEKPIIREKPLLKPAHENSHHSNSTSTYHTYNLNAQYEEGLRRQSNGAYIPSYNAQRYQRKNNMAAYEMCIKHYSYLNCNSLKDE